MPANAEEIYQLKVTLKETSPPIWRRFLVKSDTTLDTLHQILQVVMGWDNYHLHQFNFKDTYYGVPDPSFDFAEVHDENQFEIRQLLKRVKQKLTYEYDFGDSWEHEVLLEKRLPVDENVTYPLCVEGKRACPPEDCGGVWGYDGFLEIIRDENHPEHEEMLEWAGGSFDPEAFDLEPVNEMLQGIEPRRRVTFGHLPPRYSFILNPHQELRCSRCAGCDELTKLRKFVLLIHIDELGFIALGKTSRFCPDCDVLIVHQDELEAELADKLNQIAPQAVGNDYFVIGTVERQFWRRGLKGETQELEEMRQHTADFAEMLELVYEPGGWYPSE